VIADLRRPDLEMLTLGQYLQPSRDHLALVRYVHPDEFADFKEVGEQMGFATSLLTTSLLTTSLAGRVLR
jgi:lipoic acid synthetase